MSLDVERAGDFAIKWVGLLVSLLTLVVLYRTFQHDHRRKQPGGVRW